MAALCEIEDFFHRGPPAVGGVVPGCRTLISPHEGIPLSATGVLGVALIVARGVELVAGLGIHEQARAKQVDPHLDDPDFLKLAHDLWPHPLVVGAILRDERWIVNKVDGLGEAFHERILPGDGSAMIWFNRIGPRLLGPVRALPYGPHF